MELMWNDADRENWSTRRKPQSSVTFSTTTFTWTDLGSNLGLRDEKPATNLLSHEQTELLVYLKIKLAPRSKHSLTRL